MYDGARPACRTTGSNAEARHLGYGPHERAAHGNRHGHLADDDRLLRARELEAEPDAERGEDERNEPAIDLEGVLDDEEAVLDEPEQGDQQAAVAQPASAQVMGSPFKFTIFAGGVIPTGDGSNDVKTGYTAGVAVDFKVPTSPMLGLRGEALYANFGTKQSVAGFDGSFTDMGLNANGVAWFPMAPASMVSPYVTAGPSFSRLKVEAKSGSTSVSVTENHWGFNAGGGIEFGLGTLGARADVRYKRISMDGGDSYASIPITFGIRF